MNGLITTQHEREERIKMPKLACAIKSDLIGMPEVMQILGISKSALYRLRKTTDFPKGRYAYNKQKMHAPRVVFNRVEIMDWKQGNEKSRTI